MERRPLKSWLRSWFTLSSVGLLAVLCGSLAVLQYRWIGEVSTAEKERLQKELAGRLGAFSRGLEERIEGAISNLALSPPEMSGSAIEAAYLDRFRRSREPLFAKIALAIPNGETVDLLQFDPARGALSRVEWPPEWRDERDRLTARLNRGDGEPFPSQGTGLIEVPQFAPRLSHPGRGPGEERGWLILQIDEDYIRTTLAPALAGRFLSGGDYDTVIFDRARNRPIYESDPGAGRATVESPDAEVPVFAMGPGPGRAVNPPPGSRTPGHGPGPPRPVTGLRWDLVARHRAGSLEAIVAQARRRNLAVSAGMLLLIVGIAAMLVRLARQTERLAALRMNFVSGVSHELRTPLTVIRTAAFNLRGKLAHRPDQVERYGKMIEEQSEKLTALVDQVLLFSRTDAAQAARERKSVAVEDLVDYSVRSSLGDPATARCVVEKQFDRSLPRVLIDEPAVAGALRNLLDNAVKYSNGDRWIGISVVSAPTGHGQAVEIHVADRGPGIPADEREHVFEAFFRGRRALEQHIHGTGLGLNLAKRILVANGGDIRLRSDPPRGTEFIVTLPAEPAKTR